MLVSKSLRQLNTPLQIMRFGGSKPLGSATNYSQCLRPKIHWIKVSWPERVFAVQAGCHRAAGINAPLWSAGLADSTGYCVPHSKVPERRKTTNSEPESRRFACFESQRYQPAVTEVGGTESHRVSDKHVNPASLTERQGRMGRAILVRSHCLTQILLVLRLAEEGREPRRGKDTQRLQVGVGNHLVPKPNTLQKISPQLSN